MYPRECPLLAYPHAHTHTGGYVLHLGVGVLGLHSVSSGKGSPGYKVRQISPSYPPELRYLVLPAQEDQGAPRAAPVRHRVVVRGQAPPPPPQRRFSRASVTRHSSRANNKARTLPSRAIETPTPHATPPTSPTTPPVPSPSPQDTVTSNTAAAGKVTTRQHGR